MKHIITFLSFIVFQNVAISQIKVFIHGYSEDKELKAITVTATLRNCINGWSQIGDITIDSNHHFEKLIEINKPTLIYFSCNDYIETFAEPGDSIEINIKKSPMSEIHFNGFVQTKNFYYATLRGNHNRNNFFTLLESQTGKMNDVPFTISDDFTYDEKRILIRDLFNKRNEIFRAFVKENSDLSEKFKTDVRNEIEGQYFSHLLVPSHADEKLDDSYLKEIEKEDFSWLHVATSQYLMQAAYSYFVYYLDNIPGENYSAKRFANKYSNINNKIKDLQLKDYFLTQLMAFFLAKEPDNYQEIYEDYKKTCSNQKYIQSIDSLYRILINKIPGKNIQLTDSALSVKVEDQMGKSFSLGDLLKMHKDSLIFIDFWASWCGPCLLQMPYLKELEKEFDKKIVFISLSEDKSKNNWKNSITDHQLNGYQYIIDYDHKKELKKELILKSIPRFILLKTNGEVLKSDLPHPNEIHRVGQILNKILSQNDEKK